MINSIQHSHSITKKKFPPLKKGILLGLFFILLSLPLWAFAKSLEVSSDRQTIEMGDIITLTITADFQTRGSQLDLERLNDQFEVLGRQQSNQIMFINGRMSSKTQWQITLLPKQVGDLVVPPLDIDGVKSTPYKIKVLPAQTKPTNQLGNYFLESSLSKHEVYVQEEVLYSLKFYFLGAFQGNIRPPVFKNSLTTVLKDQVVYGKQVNHRQYTVYEWLYAVYPQQSGEMTISAPMISGIQQYRNRTKGIQEAAKPQTLTVLPEPVSLKHNPNDPWLPAKSVRLSEMWDTLPTTLRVGDSLTRTLILEVTGLRASQLPNLSTENQSGFKVYSDQPTTTESTLDSGLHTQQQLKQTIIFTQPGNISLPEQRINWFNTQTQKMETTILKSRQFTVLPALNGSSKSPATPSVQSDSNGQTLDASMPQSTTQESASRETSFIWPLISTLLAFAWLGTLLAYHKKNKQLKARLQQAKPADNQATAQQSTLNASTSQLCQDSVKHTPNSFYTQLRETLKQEYGIQAFSELNHPELKQAINQLEKHLFYQEALPDNTLKTICDALQTLEKETNKNGAKSTSQLASLYH